jgi:RNA polymerase sigma-70 factor (ECF subfamily)
MTDVAHANTGAQVFPVTRWSLVANAREDSDLDRGAAMEELCRTYWAPLYGYLRRSGHSPHDAEDYTQGFLLSLIQDESLVRADPERGRLRSFLLGGLKRYVGRVLRDGNRLKRGGGVERFSLDAAEAEQRYESMLVDEITPEHMYDRMWVSTLVAGVLERLRSEMATAGKEKTFLILQPYLLNGATETGGYAKAALDLGMSEGAVKVAVHRLRGRYRELLLKHITDTLSSSDSLNDEVEYLLALAGR